MREMAGMRGVMRVTVAVLAFAGLAALSACNTVEGIGRDIERGGEKLQDVAR